MPRKIIYPKSGGQAVVVMYSLLLKVDSDVIIVLLLGPFHDLAHFLFGQNHGEETVLQAVVCEDIGEGRCDHRAKTEISECPHRMLAGRAAAKILSRHQDA